MYFWRTSAQSRINLLEACFKNKLVGHSDSSVQRFCFCPEEILHFQKKFQQIFKKDADSSPKNFSRTFLDAYHIIFPYN